MLRRTGRNRLRPDGSCRASRPAAAALAGTLLGGGFAGTLLGGGFAGTLAAAEPAPRTAAAPVRPVAADAPKIDFRRDVQPILARNCVACHGPDKAEGGLRFTTESTVFTPRDSDKIPVVKHAPEESEIIRRVLSADDSERMPPHGKPLTAGQVAVLKTWISQGASWRGHWAFEAPAAVAPPQPADAAWVRSPLDAFVKAGLEAEGLTPAPEASRGVWLRRVTFDLIGLPPTPAEVREFESDRSPDAYERVADRLLASPHYGERWGRHWLDVVRYAETNSFERDGAKPHVWRYRDYVIRSFNDDKPYDRFLREQIAGDELPDGGNDGLIATGYHRLGLWDDEPADRELALYDGYDDLVATTSQVFLGLTLNCARCHDHKIDPLTQKDYYAMVAFFRNLTGNGTGGANVERPLFADAAAKARYDAEVRALDAQRNAAQQELSLVERDIRKILADRAGEDRVDVRDIDDLTYRFYRDSWTKLPNFDELKAESDGKLPGGRFDIRPATREDNFGFVFTGTLIVPADGEYRFELDSDDGTRLLIDGKKVVEHDGVHGEGHPQQGKVKLKAGRRPIRLEYFQGIYGKGLTVRWSGPQVPPRLLSVSKEQEERRKDRPADLRRLVREQGDVLLGKAVADRYREASRRLEDLKQQKVPSDMALVVTERGPQAPDTFLLKRGTPGMHGDKVDPAFPGVLNPPAPKIVPTNHSTGRRTALADWLAAADNPLTDRVMVNRIWQHHFGRGIVRSPNNFGLLGDPPTHPELLDWLAKEFARLGRRQKPLHRMIVLSSTYRMASTHNEAAYAKDPLNNLFWKFDGRRLEAEEVRDAILATGGQLDLTVGGPSIFPEISKEVLAGQSIPGQGWKVSPPEKQNRRSVYVHVKRSLILPILSDFDAADTDSSCAARFTTTQPTQALGMLNGKFLHDQAAAFARRLEKEAGADPAARIALAVRLATGREPTPADLDRGLKLLDTLRKDHGADAGRALELFCLTVLNRNEFVFLD